jgi:putative ABC transport system permease protein
MKAWLSFRMAFEQVRFGFGRMALAVLAIALGVGLVVAIQLMNAAVLDAFLDTIDGTAGRAALTVSAGEGFTFPETVRDTVAAVPGVALAVPLVTGIAFPDDASGELLTVHGVDLTHDAEVRVYHRGSTSGIVDDLVAFLSQTDSVIVGREFAARRGLDIGSPLPLVTPHGVQRFVVRGLLDPEGLARTLGGRLVVMDLYAAERAFATEGQINRVDLLLAPGAELEAVRTAVAAVLPPGLTVEEPALRKAILHKTVSGFQTMLTAFGLLAVVAGFVICYSRLAAMFEARAWQTGVLRAVGLARSAVLGELLKESLLIGTAGAIVGIPLGILIARELLPLAAGATAINFHLPVPDATARVRFSSAVAGAALGILASVLGATVPAIRLSSYPPVVALRSRGTDLPRSESRFLRGLQLVCGIGLAGLLVFEYFIPNSLVGHVATALALAGACLFAAPLGRRGGALLARLWALVGPSGDFAAGHMVARPHRVTLVVATIGIGLSFVLMLGMLAWSFERTLVAQLTPRNQVDFVLTSSLLTGGYMSAPLPPALLDDLRGIPGVADVCAEQRKDIAYRGDTAVLDGFDRRCFDSFAVASLIPRKIVPKDLAAFRRGRAAIVSSSFAHEFGIGVHDTIRLTSPHGIQRLRVVGITGSEPVAAIIMTRERYVSSWNDWLVSWVRVALSDPSRRDEVGRTIAQRLGRRYRLLIRSGTELVNFYAEQVRQAFGVVYPMQGITFLLVLIALSDALAASVLERTREIGVLRAVGLRRRHVGEIVMLEGLAIGILGLVLAAVTGLGLGVFWVKVQFPALLGWQLDLHFPRRFALGAAALTLAMCVLASVVPSVRAARLPVSAALRDE